MRLTLEILAMVLLLGGGLIAAERNAPIDLRPSYLFARTSGLPDLVAEGRALDAQRRQADHEIDQLANEQAALRAALEGQIAPFTVLQQRIEESAAALDQAKAQF